MRRELGPSALDDLETGLRPGDHVCAFYCGDDERDRILTSYLRAGIDAGDKCICLIDSTDPEQLIDHVEDDRARVATEQQLELQAARGAYLQSGRFSTSSMLGYLDEMMASVFRDAQYSRARAAGEMSWALAQPPGAEELLDYESELNRFAPRYAQILLCMYDLDRFGAGMLVEAMKTHPKVLVGAVLMENPYSFTPDEFRALHRTPQGSPSRPIPSSPVTRLVEPLRCTALTSPDEATRKRLGLTRRARAPEIVAVGPPTADSSQKRSRVGAAPSPRQSARVTVGP